MSDEMVEDPIPSSVQDFLNVFKKDLASVVFPDVSLDGLESLAQKVRSEAKELQEALKRAEAARVSLEAGRNELLARATRGLAYAKVFAEGNDELLEKLSGINFGKSGRGPKKTASEKPKAEKSEAQAAPADAQKTEDKKSAKASKKAAEQVG
jgi:hypothetical protein